MTPTRSDYLNEFLHGFGNMMMLAAVCLACDFSVYMWSVYVTVWSFYDIRLTWRERFGTRSDS